MNNWQEQVKSILEEGGDHVMVLGSQLMVLYSTSAPIMVRESDKRNHIVVVAKIEIPGHIEADPNAPFFDQCLSMTQKACDFVGGSVLAKRDPEDQSVVAVYEISLREGLPIKQDLRLAIEKIKAVINKLF